MLNIGSLALGLGSWILGALAIRGRKTVSVLRNVVFSFVLCAVSLLLQLFEINSRANMGDYSAVSDTIHAILVAAVVLLSVTTALNGIALAKAEKQP